MKVFYNGSPQIVRKGRLSKVYQTSLGNIQQSFFILFKFERSIVSYSKAYRYGVFYIKLMIVRDDYIRVNYEVLCNSNQSHSNPVGLFN